MMVLVDWNWYCHPQQALNLECCDYDGYYCPDDVVMMQQTRPIYSSEQRQLLLQQQQRQQNVYFQVLELISVLLWLPLPNFVGYSFVVC